MNISESLKDFLDDKKNDKITAVAIAKYLGISKKTLSNYVNGDAYMPLIYLNKLSNFFNVSVDYLLGFTKKEKYSDNTILKELDAKLIGERLKTIRKERNITQEKLAMLIGINKSSISRYEHGESLILTICLYTICKEFRISSDYLLGKIAYNPTKELSWKG